MYLPYDAGEQNMVHHQSSLSGKRSGYGECCGDAPTVAFALRYLCYIFCRINAYTSCICKCHLCLEELF